MPLSVDQVIQHGMVRLLVKSELKRIWKESVVA